MLQPLCQLLWFIKTSKTSAIMISFTVFNVPDAYTLFKLLNFIRSMKEEIPVFTINTGISRLLGKKVFYVSQN